MVGVKTFVDQEAEFRMTASEIIQGLAAPKDYKNTSSQKHERKSKVTTFVMPGNPSQSRTRRSSVNSVKNLMVCGHVTDSIRCRLRHAGTSPKYAFGALGRLTLVLTVWDLGHVQLITVSPFITGYYMRTRLKGSQLGNPEVPKNQLRGQYRKLAA